jgi:hypothetical protein
LYSLHEKNVWVISMRNAELDRPALTYTQGGEEREIPQQVCIDGSWYNLDYAIEKGLIKEGDVKRESASLEEYALKKWRG